MGAAVGLVALVGSAAFAGDLFGIRQRLLDLPQPQTPAVGRAATESTPTPETTATPGATLVRSQPWWQEVAVLDGGSARATSVAIDERALQWRVEWRCEHGTLDVETAADVQPPIDATCPAEGTSYATETGPFELSVAGSDAFRVRIEQQVDVPLEEPPLAEMTAPGSGVFATGEFYGMDRRGSGTVTIYELADGSHALRLEEFFVTPNVDLEITFSELAAPQTTEEYEGASSTFVAPLDVTAGSMNFHVPPEVDPGSYRSVVIWCPPLNVAYAAATLEAAP